MNTSLLLFVGIHTLLYLLWRGRGWYEMNVRTDGRLPAFYWTGDIGDTIGFTLVMIAWHYNVDLLLLLLCLIPAGFITYLLHHKWRKTAISLPNIASLHFANGSSTLGGKLHLVYVVYVAAISLALVYQLYANNLSVVQMKFFLGGTVFYLLTVVIDRYRGVI